MVVAFTVALATGELFSLLEWVMLIVAMLIGRTGLIYLVSPESSRGLAEQVLTEKAFIRFRAGIGVVFGSWLIYLSLSV